MTSHLRKNPPLASESSLRRSVCAYVPTPLAAVRTRSPEPPAVPQAMHANNGFVWR